MTTATFPLLIESALRALLVALVVWAGLRLFRVGNVMAQKAAWTMVLAAAVVMPLLMRWQGIPALATLRVPQAYLGLGAQNSTPAESAISTAPASVLSTPVPPQADASPQSASSIGDRFPAPVISKSEYGATSAAPLQQSQMERVGPPAPIARRSRPVLVNWQLLSGLLYIAVAAALLLRMILGLTAAFRLWSAAQPISLGDDRNSIPGLHLRCSSAIASPVTIGSAVLLPADYVQWDAEKLRIVLAHERSHIHQGDFYLQLLASLYAALFWFSPLGWWLKSKLSNLGEAIGDHAALNQAASPASYAQLLLEFAALPRPTLIGVAMARPSTISQRIERLLNDNAFRHAFAGSRSRALLAVLIVPVAVFAATALLRVEAASVAQASSPSAPAAPATPASSAAPASSSSPSAASVPAESTSPDSALKAPAAAPSTEPANVADSVLAPLPPLPPGAPIHLDLNNLIDLKNLIDLTSTDTIRKQVQEQVAAIKMLSGARVYQLEGAYGDHSGYSYGYSKDGESWAIVSGPGEKTRFSGDWNGATAEAIEKARRIAHGQFLWFTKNGKSYVVEDPAVIAQIQAMYKPMEDLGREQAELGRKQADLGKLQGELGRQLGQAKITAPDISKEMAELTAATSKLQAQMGKEISREELAELQGKLAQLQGKLGSLYSRYGVTEGDFGAKMSKLGEEQGKLGAEQGKLGAEQGRLGREADQKARSILDQSLQNGKAKPVE